MRNPNGYGSIIKLSGNRRKPYACRLTVGWKDDEAKGTSYPIYKYISYHATRKEALKALAEYNNDPYTVTKKTFKEVYEEWYKSVEEKRAKGTLKNYNTAYRQLKSIHSKKLSELDKKTLQALFKSLDTTDIAANNVRKTLQLIFDYAIRDGILPSSYRTILKDIDKSGSKASKEIKRRPFTKEEIDWLWENKDNEMIKIILVYIYTGLRYSELLNLKPEDCHDDFVYIREAKTKAGVREVPLCDKIKALLPISTIPKYTAFNKYFHLIVGNDHTIHDTRHTFVSLMVERGVDERIIQSIVGHNNSSVTDLYTHIPMSLKLEAVNKL